MLHPLPLRLVAATTALLGVGAVSCTSAPNRTTVDAVQAPTSATEAEPSVPKDAIEPACASEPPASAVTCSPQSYCVRPPTAEHEGVHCYCKDESPSCRPVLMSPPKGPCTDVIVEKDVLVYEKGVVVGFSCMCAGGPQSWWICNAPPPG